MLKTANKISFLIESQLPDFINEDYELFGKFIRKYYEQLELQGQSTDIITNLETYRDIDFYEKNVLKQSTILDGDISPTDKTVTVEDATSFPKNGGYIKIGEEDGVNGNETIDFCFKKGEEGKYVIEDDFDKSHKIKWKSLDQAVIDGAKSIDDK